MSSAAGVRLLMDFGADAAGRVDFQQQRMPQRAVDDVNFADAPIERLQARFDFGNHARPVMVPSAISARASTADSEWMIVQGSSLSADAVDVGKEDQLFGAERLRDGHRGGIGVDVVTLAVGTFAHRRDHRDLVGIGQAFDDIAIDPRDVADGARDRRHLRRASFSPNRTLVV
jgi:hypothetical protein